MYNEIFIILWSNNNGIKRCYEVDGKFLKNRSMNQSGTIQLYLWCIRTIFLCEPNQILSLDTLRIITPLLPTLHKIKKVDYNNGRRSGRGSVRIECTVRVREVGGSNPPAPTPPEGEPDALFFIPSVPKGMLRDPDILLKQRV